MAVHINQLEKSDSPNMVLVTDGSGNPYWGSVTAGVSSVSGTANRITSTGGATPVIDIDAAYIGQNSITTLGTVTTGTLSTGAVIAGVTMTLGSDATGDIYYRNSGGVLTRLAAGSNGDVLTLATGLPSWAAASGGGSNTALSNLASVSINTSLLAQTGVDLGSTTKPFRDLYLFGAGTYATTYLKLTGTPTSTRTITIPDTTDTIALLGLAQTFTGANTHSGLNAILHSSSGITVRNPANTFSYTIAAGAIAADRTLKLPVLTATDTVAVLGLAQSFTKTQTFSASNFITGAFVFGGGSGNPDFKTTNGGSSTFPYIFIGVCNSFTAGLKAVSFNSSGNVLSFCAANGTRYISRATIDITNLTNTAGSEVGDLIFSTQSGGTAATQKMRISGLGNIVMGNEAAIATNATDGFLYIPTCAGTPTGVPTAYTGKVAMVYDTTNNKFYIYNAGWLGGTVPGVFS